MVASSDQQGSCNSMTLDMPQSIRLTHGIQVVKCWRKSGTQRQILWSKKPTRCSVTHSMHRCGTCMECCPPVAIVAIKKLGSGALHYLCLMLPSCWYSCSRLWSSPVLHTDVMPPAGIAMVESYVPLYMIFMQLTANNTLI